MAWINLKPENPGGGRTRQPPAAKLSVSGQLVLNHEAADMLGRPDRLLVSVNPEASMFRLFPTTPDNSGAFAVSGGGGSPPRIKIMAATAKWPHLVGEYQVVKITGGVEMRKKSTPEFE